MQTGLATAGATAGTARSAGAAPVSLGRFGDWTSWSSLLVLVLLLPLSVLSVAALTSIPAVAGPLFPHWTYVWTWAAATVAYFAALPLLFLPGLGRLRIRLFLPQTRPPTPTERSVLRPAWDAVLARAAGQGDRRYRLRMLDVDAVNAAAGCGRLVLATSHALAALPRHQLEAVLAHELGHHTGLHPVVTVTRIWLVRPVVWFHALALRVLHFMDYLVAVSATRWIAVALRVLLLVPIAVLHLVRLALNGASAVLMFFGRQAEHRADLTAVRLGYGDDLIEALQTIEDQNEPDDGAAAGALSGVWATHPDAARRVRRIRRALAER
ncbi:MAG TPA: hypothetical protein DEP66_01340 [Acidimicrobiaceae bacterium]|nr:hypothetical protein [Acidimicrobiaceae bacterium]HCB36883.1 hypothetical protein [Acidimicrobiaceae bacterium]